MSTFVPLDGRITSLQMLTALTGGEVMEIVSPGNAAQGNNFQITTSVLGAFFSAFTGLNTEIIVAGATLAAPYNVLTTDTKLLFNKTVSSPSYAVLPTSMSMAYPFPVLFKDLKGDAKTNNITITFSNGEQCDGLSQVVINSAYGWVWISPIPGSNGWYLTS
jgi:hypothetical protein